MIISVLFVSLPPRQLGIWKESENQEGFLDSPTELYSKTRNTALIDALIIRCNHSKLISNQKSVTASKIKLLIK